MPGSPYAAPACPVHEGWSPSFEERLAAYPVMLAPMAGVTDPVYRRIAHEHGCPLCYTEMVSVAGLAYGGKATWDLVEPCEQEAQIAVQLFGSRPEQFAPAAGQIVERLGGRLALIDINMACPVPKVFKKGEGSALMGDPERACACLRETMRGVSGAVPVTCKIRAGIYQSEVLAPEFAKRLQEAGACGVAVHGRAAKQFYTGKADWSVIRAVVESLDIPVVGSGDVMCALDCVEMLRQTGAKGVFVARGSYGNPWIFRDAYALLNGREPEGEPTVGQRLDALELHIRRSAEAGSHMVRLRPVTCWYIKGMPGAAEWRGRSMACKTADDFLALVADMRAACREHGIL